MTNTIYKISLKLGLIKVILHQYKFFSYLSLKSSKLISKNFVRKFKSKSKKVQKYSYSTLSFSMKYELDKTSGMQIHG